MAYVGTSGGTRSNIASSSKPAKLRAPFLLCFAPRVVRPVPPLFFRFRTFPTPASCVVRSGGARDLSVRVGAKRVISASRKRASARARGNRRRVARRRGDGWGERFRDGADARSIVTRPSFAPSPSSISYSLSSLPPPSASALSFSSASRRAAATCFGRGVRWGLRSAMARQAGEKVGIRGGARTRVASHLTSRVLIHALERLRNSLDTRRFALAHRARLPSDARGGSGFAGATRRKPISKARRGFFRPRAPRTWLDRPLSR